MSLGWRRRLPGRLLLLYLMGALHFSLALLLLHLLGLLHFSLALLLHLLHLLLTLHFSLTSLLLLLQVLLAASLLFLLCLAGPGLLLLPFQVQSLLLAPS